MCRLLTGHMTVEAGAHIGPFNDVRYRTSGAVPLVATFVTLPGTIRSGYRVHFPFSKYRYIGYQCTQQSHVPSRVAEPEYLVL
jgi:hypothetical protein